MRRRRTAVLQLLQIEGNTLQGIWDNIADRTPNCSWSTWSAFRLSSGEYRGTGIGAVGGWIGVAPSGLLAMILLTWSVNSFGGLYEEIGLLDT